MTMDRASRPMSGRSMPTLSSDLAAARRSSNGIRESRRSMSCSARPCAPISSPMRRSSMLPLETLQRVMTASILSQTSSRLGSKLQAGDANPVNRFSIYRNNTLISLTGSLKANFPVTVRLVHERFFHWVAQEFIRRHPPEEARLSSYGAKLPAYLASLAACRSVPYVAEVARLEWAICTSLHAEEHDPCGIETLSRLGG